VSRNTTYSGAITTKALRGLKRLKPQLTNGCNITPCKTPDHISFSAIERVKFWHPPTRPLRRDTGVMALIRLTQILQRGRQNPRFDVQQETRTELDNSINRR
jgi:hypothetical protein